MAREKRIKISPAGTGEQETYDEAVVRPGDRPRDVLARIIDEQPDEFILRRKTSRAFPQTLDVYGEVEDGEKLKVATNATVGIGG